MSKSQEAQELRLIRKRISLTQAAMAVCLTVSQSAYEKYERGERGVPCALLAKAHELERERKAEKEAPTISAQTAAGPGRAGKTDRFERWIQGCWTLFTVSAIWLVLRIATLQVGADFLRLGPNDEALGIAFLLFAVLAILLGHETWRRACQGLPIRNQRRAA